MVKSKFVFLTHNTGLVTMFALLSGLNLEPGPFVELFHLENSLDRSGEDADEACMYGMRHTARTHSAPDSWIMLTVVQSPQYLDPVWFHFGTLEWDLIIAVLDVAVIASEGQNGICWYHFSHVSFTYRMLAYSLHFRRLVKVIFPQDVFPLLHSSVLEVGSIF